MTRFCPRCRETPPDGQRFCPRHGRYAVTEDALTRLDDAPLLGRTLEERYALVDYIGGGGMGAVYEGLDLRLERPVAVKILHLSLTSTAGARTRFEREAQAISRLTSQHTVTLFDYGVAREEPLPNTAFMVMELVRGESLAQRLRREPLHAAEAAIILEQVADSLGEAHRLDIIHRDVKPENILLTRSHDGQLVAKLIDFGIAHVEGGRLTSTGIFVGTPQYMAPEQCADAGQIDARADVYAMGIVLYESLCGHCPFDGPKPIAVLIDQVK